MIRDLFRKYKKLIIVCLSVTVVLAALCAAGVYLKLSNDRTYVASVNFRFTNEAASSGYAYDGTKLNFEEIKGAEVLKKALEKFDRDTDLSVDELAAHIQVEEVIPEDEQDKINSALDNGKEYEYIPIEFKATLEMADPNTGKLLSCISESYYEYYAENHVVKAKLPGIPEIGDFDYIESATLLRDSILAAEDYLKTAGDTSPDFRSSENGYLFSDILAEYQFLYDNDLSELFAVILTNKASKNPELLVANMRKKISQNDAEVEDAGKTVGDLRDLIMSYSEKNKADGRAENGYGDLAIDENHQNIIDYVYENDSNPTATYDALFNRFNSTLDQMSMDEIENEYCRYLISVFDGAEPIKDEVLAKNLDDRLEVISKQYQKLYELTVEAKTENDTIAASQVLKQLNTPYAVSTKRVGVYVILAFVGVIILMAAALPLIISLYFKYIKFRQEEEGLE